jgi:hypothetical protein
MHPNLCNALARKFKHIPPFSPEETTGVLGLIYHEGAGSLGEVHSLQKLLSLTLLTWADVDFLELNGVPLRSFESWDSELGSLQPLIDHCPRIDSIVLNRCDVTDLSPLLDLKGLDRITLYSCPLDEHSWREVLPEVLSRGRCKHVGNYRMMNEEEFLAMRAMAEAGVKLCVMEDTSGTYSVCRPGYGHPSTMVGFQTIPLIRAATDAYTGPMGDTDAFWAHLQQSKRKV